MLTRRLHSLQWRFTLVVIASALFFAAVVGTVAYRNAHAKALQQGAATLEGLMAAVETTAAMGAFARDTVLLQEVIDGLARHPLVSSVAVLSPGEQVVVQRVPRNLADITVALTRPLWSPFNRAERVGTLRVAADDAVLQAAARAEATTHAALMVAQTGLMAALLYFAAAAMVSRPIVQLARALERIQPGTGERLPTPPRHARDEIGTLIAGANSLLAETQAALQRERTLRAEVEAMEAQYRQIFDATSAGIFVLDADGRLINGNPTVLKVMDASAQQVQQLRGHDFVRQVFARPERVREMIDASRRRNETVSGDLELRGRDGVVRWVHCLISVQQPHRAPVASEQIIEGVMYDVTERKADEQAARHRAEHDPLTGLPNRAACNALVERYVADASAAATKVALLYIDLDGFKRVNDELGHDAGDQVLVQCARRMRSAMRRASDLVGRVGGDEFVVAMPGAGGDDLATASVAASLVRCLSEPFVLEDSRVAHIGSSIGIAGFPRHGRTRRELTDAADQALYGVKRHGKNAFAVALAPRAPAADAAAVTATLTEAAL
jgi:diguanylate cyclase (GGDEF)-like protein/PAS domain S-box-containing protein